jgi:hypothetical protein
MPGKKNGGLLEKEDLDHDGDAEGSKAGKKRLILLAHLGMLLVGTIFGGLNVITSRALKGECKAEGGRVINNEDARGSLEDCQEHDGKTFDPINPIVFAFYRNIGSSLYIVMQWLLLEGMVRATSKTPFLTSYCRL